MRKLFLIISLLSQLVFSQNNFGIEIGSGMSTSWQYVYDGSVTIEHEEGNSISKNIWKWKDYGVYSPSLFLSWDNDRIPVYARLGYSFAYWSEPSRVERFLPENTVFWHHQPHIGVGAKIELGPADLRIGAEYAYAFYDFGFNDSKSTKQLVTQNYCDENGNPMLTTYDCNYYADMASHSDSILFIDGNNVLQFTGPPQATTFSPHRFGFYLSYWRIGAQAMFGEHYFQWLLSVRVWEF